jgi:hypothetical protein
MRDLF